MKNKKTLFLVLGALVLAGCNVTPPSSSSTAPSTPSSPSTPNTSSSTQAPSGVTHLDPLVREIENPSATRTYKADFDTMLDDFSTTGTENNRLRVLIDSNDAGESGFFPDSVDKAIYKMATGAHAIQNFEGIGFRVRKVGEGTLDYSNLVLALRGGDAWKTYPISLSDALTPDAEALPELTSEYQDIVIAPGQTIEDDTTEYETLEGAPSGTKVLDMILGFHLYATGECAQMIEIEEVFLMNAGEKTTLDNFSRTAVNKTDDTCWWRDSTGLIIRKGAKLANSSVTVASEGVGEYGNIALTVLGDTTGTTIAPITASGKGEAVNWSNLKDASGAAVSNAVNGAYYSLTANFEASGISTEGLTGFEISSTSEVFISEVFLTNFKDKEAVTEYPKVDAANASIFDNFNRTQSGFDGDYDASSTNQTVLDAGLNYALSYNNGDKVSVANGYATFDATNLAAGDYINFKEGNDDAYHGEKYLVLSVKLEDGATMNDFRFDIGSGVTYVNQMFSATGLPVPMTFDASYPYTTADGFSWLIIDLAESGMTAGAYIDFYYSGVGKLLIDCAFYANEYVNYEVKEVVRNTIADLSGYNYVGGFDVTEQLDLRVTFTSTTEGQTLKSLRFASAAGEHWFKDGKVVDTAGNVIAGDTVIPAEGLTVVISMAASGFEAGAIHLHSGGFDGSAGDITIVVETLKVLEYKETEVVRNTIADLSGYNYVGGFDVAAQCLLKVTFTSETEGQTLKSLRFASAAGEHWFKDGKVIDAEGNVIAGDTVIPAEGLTVVIDMEASGFEAGAIHLHSGGFDGSAGDITVVVNTLTSVSYAEVMGALAQ